MAYRSITSATSTLMSLWVYKVAKPFSLSCDIVLLKYVFKRRTYEAARSHVQLVTGNTARIFKAVKMLGKAILFTFCNVSAMVFGVFSSQHPLQADSQLSTSYERLSGSGKSLA